MKLRMCQKFAWRDSVYISMRMGLEVTNEYLDEDACLHMLTFGQCADHLRHEVCDALGADKTCLGSIEDRIPKYQPGGQQQ